MRGFRPVFVRAFAALASLMVVEGLIAAPRALALEVRGGEDIVVAAGETLDDDLYAFGRDVTINGTVQGDVVFAGNTLTLNGAINGNLIGAGQTLIINGSVRDTARLAGQAVVLGNSARVGRDVLFGGYSLEQQAGSRVGRDLAVGGYQALLAGSVGRNVTAGVGAFDLSGTVDGDVQVDLGDSQPSQGAAPPPFVMPQPAGVAIPYVAPGLIVRDTAQIGGKLAYTAAAPMPVSGRVAGGTAFTPRAVEPVAPMSSGAILADLARRFIGLAIVGLVLLWLAPRWMSRLGDIVEGRPLQSAGWGLVASAAAFGAMVAGIVATIAVATAFGSATLGGLAALVVVLGALYEALLVAGFVIYGTLVAHVVVGNLVGRRLLGMVQPRLAKQPAVPMLAGIALLVAASAIPTIGGLVTLLVVLLALGAAWQWGLDRLRPVPAMPIIAPVAPSEEQRVQAA
jgi:hypothetical protein